MPETISIVESSDPKDAQHLVFKILKNGSSIGKVAILEESETKVKEGELITAWILFDFYKNQTKEVFPRLSKKSYLTSKTNPIILCFLKK